MVTLDANMFIQVIHLLFGSEIAIRNKRGPLSPELRASSDAGADTLEGLCRKLELPVSASVAGNMLKGCTESEQLHEAIKQLANTFCLEIEKRKYYGPLQAYLKYYEPDKLFGQQVFNNFASANDDIFEAGTCLALERPTACVMHLMRVLEASLSALAKTVGVAKQNDWGRYLSEINAELDARAATAGARSVDEQFYAEAAANFDRLRRAFRNPTMHPDRSYSQERAEEILIAVKSFVAHLATKIAE